MLKAALVSLNIDFASSATLYRTVGSRPEANKLQKLLNSNAFRVNLQFDH